MNIRESSFQKILSIFANVNLVIISYIDNHAMRKYCEMNEELN